MVRPPQLVEFQMSTKSKCKDHIGIGAAMTSALVQTGARKVYILGRRLDSLQNTAATIDPEGNVIIPLKCDVTDLESVSSAVKVVESNEGYIDVLINNAGINGPRHASVYQLETIKDVQSFLLTDYNDWEMVHAVNTCAVGGVAVAFLHLLEAGNGRRGWKTGKFADEEGARPRSKVDGINEDDLRTSQIITVASIAGLHRRITAGIPYATSKIGATYLGKMLATLLAPYGIRSNVVCPGSEYSPVSLLFLLVSRDR